MDSLADKTCSFCGEFFSVRNERNKHKCPYFIQQSSKSTATAPLSISPIKPDNYKLSLNSSGRIELRANYRCDLCLPQVNQIFSTAEEFTEHKMQMHCVSRKELTQKKKLLSRRVLNITPNFFGTSTKCAKCDMRFTDSTEYRRHLIENHLSPRGNRNRITSHLELAEVLANNKNCIAEQIDDEAEGIRLDEYKCSLCKEKFAEKSQLFDHTANIHHKLLMYECSKCAQMFVHRLALTRHLQSHKEINELFSPQDAFECEFCGKQFTFESYYKRHLATHTGSSFYTCDICGDDFRSQNQLVLHRSAHTGDERFPCPKCKKQFAYKSMLERHSKTHIGESQPCPVCGKSFNVASLLQKHMVVEHSDADKVQSCPECGKKFLFPSYLERHMVSHSLMISKTIECPMCPKLFNKRPNLLNHLKIHLPKEEKHRSMYRCPVCSKPYKRESTLDKHLRTFHYVGNLTSPLPMDQEYLLTQNLNRQQLKKDTFRMKMPNGKSRLIATNRIRTTSGQEYFAVPLDGFTETSLNLNDVQVSVSYCE